MGPQPWELRKQEALQALARRQRSFNGAAALGAAETSMAEQGRTGVAGFNGAAALGAAETR
jgi:hypothetical protein